MAVALPALPDPPLYRSEPRDLPWSHSQLTSAWRGGGPRECRVTSAVGLRDRLPVQSPQCHRQENNRSHICTKFTLGFENLSFVLFPLLGKKAETWPGEPGVLMASASERREDWSGAP